jgi:hypothetical protein
VSLICNFRNWLYRKLISIQKMLLAVRKSTLKDVWSFEEGV